MSLKLKVLFYSSKSSREPQNTVGVQIQQSIGVTLRFAKKASLAEGNSSLNPNAHSPTPGGQNMPHLLSLYTSKHPVYIYKNYTFVEYLNEQMIKIPWQSPT